MELVLESWPSRILAAAVVVAATAALSAELWKHVEAERLAQEGSIKSLHQALRLEPRNAELYWQLGRAELFSEAGSPSAAVAALDEATELDPHSGAYWADLSQARENAGDIAGAARALEEAREAEPRTPRMLWQSMSFALRNNQPERALELGRELVAAAPPYTSRVLPQLSEVADLSTLIATVLPADRDAIDDVTAYLCNRLEAKPAEILWSRVMASGIPPSGLYLRRFLDTLIARGEGELARRVWKDSIERGWIEGDAQGLDEPLYNSDFRRPMLGFGFDWKVIPQEEVSVWVSDEGPVPGEPCLCADFTAQSRADFYQVSHAVVVEPGEEYLLTAKMRVRHLGTLAGAFLVVSGLGAAGQQPATTEHVTGSTGWEDLSAEFAAGPETHLAQVVLARPGVRNSEPAASGQVCLAEVQWRRLQLGGASSAGGVPQKTGRGAER
jgi:tetratricopeptide (TPR) repeat protein